MKRAIIILGLVIANFSYAEEIKMPKDQWLSNLQGILPEHLCKPESPLMKVYKGTDCLSDMKGLYKKCTTEVNNVVIPENITSVPQANLLGQVIAECMSAHYQGGKSLEMFNLIQSMSNKQK